MNTVMDMNDFASMQTTGHVLEPTIRVGSIQHRIKLNAFVSMLYPSEALLPPAFQTEIAQWTYVGANPIDKCNDTARNDNSRVDSDNVAEQDDGSSTPINLDANVVASCDPPTEPAVSTDDSRVMADQDRAAKLKRLFRRAHRKHCKPVAKTTGPSSQVMSSTKKNDILMQ
jgi:hypothetical protein